MMALAAGEHRDVQAKVALRRLGAPMIWVEGAQGALLAGAFLQVRDPETATLVSDWVAQGLIHSPWSQTTDLEGRLTLRGLPEGDYTLRIRASRHVLPGGDPQSVALTQL